MRPFRATRAGYVAGLDTTERLVLAHVVGDTAELLQSAVAAGPVRGPADGPGQDVGRDVGRDPALRRLLPDASRDDAEVADEFRRLTQDDLALAKVKRLVALADALLDDPVARRAAQQGGAAPAATVAPGRPTDLVVERAAARDVASALTDARLVVAERLGIRTDEDSEELFEEVEAAASGRPAGADDATGGDGTRGFLGAVFVTLGWLQESLVGAMLADLRRGRRA